MENNINSTGKSGSTSKTKTTQGKNSSKNSTASNKNSTKNSAASNNASSKNSSAKNNSTDAKTGKKTATKNSSQTRAVRKNAVIVGASSGIGLESAKILLSQGYRVFNISRTPADNPDIINFSADVSHTKTQELEKAIQQIIQDEKKIDVFVYCAGFSLAAPLENVTDEDLRYLFEVNYFGAVRALRHIIPIMRTQQSGRIVFVSSLAGSVPIAFDAPYSASKACLDMTAKELFIELKPYNIHVSSFTPGGVSTSFTFKRKIYDELACGEYFDSVKKSADKLADTEQNGMEPATVAQHLYDIISCPNPPLIYAPGLKNTAIRLASKVLPSCLTAQLSSCK